MNIFNFYACNKDLKIRYLSDFIRNISFCVLST